MKEGEEIFSPSEWPVSSFPPAVCSRYEGLACSFWHTAGARSHSCQSSPAEDQVFRIQRLVPASCLPRGHSSNNGAILIK